MSGSDVGHGLLVALLVAFPVAWMTEVVVVVVGGFLASHVKLAVVLSFLNSRFLGWPLSRVALLVGSWTSVTVLMERMTSVWTL